jgi:GTPase SAR1 family protein
MARKR